MLKRIYIDNYKCLVNFDLPLEELTLFSGVNGAGKTAILDAIFALHRLLGGAAKVTDPEIFPARTLTRWQSRRVQAFELEAELASEVLIYRIEIEHEANGGRARVLLESLKADSGILFSFREGKVQLYRDDYSEGPVFFSDWTESAMARIDSRNDNTRLTRFLEFVRKILVCGIYPASFLTEASSDSAALLRDGSNFCAWYWHLQLERPDRVSEFASALRDVMDDFRGVRLEKVGLDTRALMVAFEGGAGRYELRFDEISDGQRALIALYALIGLAAGQGYTLFLDEPENYLALSEIQPWLIELADRCGDSVPQAVLCSHHPELIDYLGGAHGLILRRENSGATRVQGMAGIKIEGGLALSELIARGWER